jgi:hypothetical protein
MTFALDSTCRTSDGNHDHERLESEWHPVFKVFCFLPSRPHTLRSKYIR